MMLMVLVKVLACVALVAANDLGDPTGKDECSGAPRLEQPCRNGSGICYFRPGLFGIYGHMGCIASCGDPPVVPNAVLQANLSALDFNSTLEGSELTYECAEGYSAPECSVFTITCTYYGEWTPIGFECTADCGPFVVSDYFDNAEVLSECGTNDGDVITVTCLDGYAPTGDLLATCKEDGDWETTGGTCVRDCGLPPFVDETTVNFTSTLAGAVATYDCCNGDSSFYVTCDGETGEWSAVGSCPAECPTPADVDGACYSVSDLLEGTTATYTCYGSGVTFDITCGSDGQWSAPTDSCPEDCGIPPVVPGTTVLGVSSTYANGGSATYQCCSDGSTFMITCGADGNWNDVGSCPAECPTPADVDGACYSVSDLLEGTTATYTCYGSGVTFDITCGSDGQWSAPTDSCPEDCGIPPVVPGTTVVGVSSTYANGGSATYQCCSDGSTFTIACGADGNWTDVGSCPAECPTPADVDGACYSVSDLLEGTTATYTCYGSGVTFDITCGSDGQWSAPPDSCPEDCGIPPVVPGTTVVGVSSTYANGGSATYQCCSDGSTFTIACGADGNWTDVGSCPAECPTPADVDGACYSVSDLLEGTTATYTCYGSTVTFDITCGSDGQWSAPPDSCPEDCGIPPVVPGTTVVGVSSTYANGGSATYQCCSDGSTFTIACGADGNWTDVGSCPADCGTPPVVQHSTVVEVTNTYAGGVVTYECCFSDATFTSTCRADGTWSDAGTCPGETTCSDGDLPSVADSSSNDYSNPEGDGTSPVGTVVTFQCDYGSPVVSVCTASGTWSPAACPPAPECCEFPFVEYASSNNHSGDATSPSGTEVAVTCDNGDVIIVECDANGDWSNNQCPEPECPVPPSIPFSSGSNYTGSDPSPVGTIIVYECNNGDEVFSTCLADGTWSYTECSGDCGVPPQVDGFGGPEYNSTQNGDVAIYDCNGTPVTVYCVGGVWQSPGTCEPPGECPLPPEFGNTAYNITYTGTNEGDTAEYVCADTAINVSNGTTYETLTCTGGSWGTLTLQCISVLLQCTEDQIDTGRPSDVQGNAFGDCCYYPTQSSDTVNGTISYCQIEPMPDNANFEGQFSLATAETYEEAIWLMLYAATVLQSNEWWANLIYDGTNEQWVRVDTMEPAPYVHPELTDDYGPFTDGYCAVFLTDSATWVERQCDRTQDKYKGICKICFPPE